jgi:ribosome-binding factor A
MRHKSSIPNRAFRVADQIQRDLGELIPREVKDSRVGMITVTRVEVTPDYAHAKVYFSQLIGNPVESAAALNEKTHHLNSLLFKRLHIHTVPRLKFVYDDTTARAGSMSALIAQAVASRAKDDVVEDSASVTADSALQDTRIKDEN